MRKLTLGIIREDKTPPDKRVPLSPAQCKKVKEQFGIEVLVEKSSVRCFEDEAYKMQGISVADDLSGCDVLLGVKEVPVDNLIPEKTYFFFSHTIKEQPYNRKLLQTILERKIRLIDYECLTDERGMRIIGFGRYAGIVGCYNGFLAYGEKTGAFRLKPAWQCEDRREVEQELKKVVLPPMKIVLTGSGRVAKGALEILNSVGVKQVQPEEILEKDFNEPVFAQLTPRHYYRTKNGAPFDRETFFNSPQEFESDFSKFTKVAEMFIAGHYWNPESSYILTREDIESPDFRINTIADISCDIAGPIASTIRPSTIEQPLYGYDKLAGKEAPFNAPQAITVMAVDNLPCELPKDASEDFGNELINNVLPFLLGEDTDKRIKRATIAENGELTANYGYLKNYVEGK